MRLPRDWLGPREKLVPFGQGTWPPVDGAEPAQDEVRVAGDPDLDLDQAVSLATEAPPSAQDFWGERSAAVHDALQAPAENDSVEALPRQAPRRLGPANRIGRPTIRVREMPRRRLAAVAAAGAALAVAFAIAMLSTQSPQHPITGAKLDMGSIIGSSVSKLLDIGPPSIASSAAVSRHRPRVAHRISHHGAKPRRQVTHHLARRAPVPTYAAREVPAHRTQVASAYHPSVGTSTPHTETSAPSSRSSTSSRANLSPTRATVSSTGQSGALGPVSSPNG